MAYAVLSFYALLRKRRLMRKLQVGRDDLAFWQRIAGGRLKPPPLQLAGMEELLRQIS